MNPAHLLAAKRVGTKKGFRRLLPKSEVIADRHRLGGDRRERPRACAAGHVNLQTTQRYLHLSSRAKGQAISALDAAHMAGRGDVGETGVSHVENVKAQA